MITLVKSVSDAYDEYMASGDPRVVHWMFMGSPLPTFTLVVLYVLFVKKIGPAWMKNRNPFDLRYTMFIYNFALVFINIYLLYEGIRLMLKFRHSWTFEIDTDKNNPDVIRLIEIGWWFFIIKFVELTDTVFFVLRKKNQQISTLHVVHHALVPICVWWLYRMEPGSYNYFLPFTINTIVHIVMYSYYGLAAIGPSVQRYLWWKKYLTTLQMIQFVMVFFFILYLLTATDCKVTKSFIFLNTFIAGMFLIMFYDYFQKTYFTNKAMKKQKYIDAANKAANVKKIAAM